jgi:F0F1-type ATP synthase alpha subunit
MDFSDGIARVHGMNNVQAEELVEYVAIAITPIISLGDILTNNTGSPPVSRACA